MVQAGFSFPAGERTGEFRGPAEGAHRSQRPLGAVQWQILSRGCLASCPGRCCRWVWCALALKCTEPMPCTTHAPRRLRRTYVNKDCWLASATLRRSESGVGREGGSENLNLAHHWELMPKGLCPTRTCLRLPPCGSALSQQTAATGRAPGSAPGGAVAGHGPRSWVFPPVLVNVSLKGKSSTGVPIPGRAEGRSSQL